LEVSAEFGVLTNSVHILLKYAEWFTILELYLRVFCCPGIPCLKEQNGFWGRKKKTSLDKRWNFSKEAEQLRFEYHHFLLEEE
jgi:hypothetical protein